MPMPTLPLSLEEIVYLPSAGLIDRINRAFAEKLEWLWRPLLDDGEAQIVFETSPDGTVKGAWCGPEDGEVRVTRAFLMDFQIIDRSFAGPLPEEIIVGEWRLRKVRGFATTDDAIYVRA